MESSGEKRIIGLEEFPENCISSILSFTTPLDAARLALVSQKWRSAADSDAVWKKMLPNYYHQIFPRAITPIPDSPSIKQTYLNLPQTILIDSGTKRISVDRSTGKVGCTVSAQDLSIVWGDGNRYWNWVSRQDSRIEEVAVLRRVRWFQIKGRFDCRILSPNTRYRVSFVVRIDENRLNPNGDSVTPFKFSLDSVNGHRTEFARYLNELVRPVESRSPFFRAANGWMKFTVGEFLLEENEGIPREIGFDMENTKSSINRGICIKGARIEPVL